MLADCDASLVDDGADLESMCGADLESTTARGDVTPVASSIPDTPEAALKATPNAWLAEGRSLTSFTSQESLITQDCGHKPDISQPSSGTATVAAELPATRDSIATGLDIEIDPGPAVRSSNVGAHGVPSAAKSRPPVKETSEIMRQ